MSESKSDFEMVDLSVSADVDFESVQIQAGDIVIQMPFDVLIEVAINMINKKQEIGRALAKAANKAPH